MNQKVAVLLIFPAFLAIAGCARSDRQSETGPAGERDTGSSVETIEKSLDEIVSSVDGATPAVPMRLTDEGQARASSDDSQQAGADAPPLQSADRAGSPAPAPAAPRSRNADPRDTAFAEVRFRFTTVYPYDLAIGPLQHSYVGSISDRSAYRSARSFFTALADGELDGETLSSDIGQGARAILDELLWKSADFADVRIGGVRQLSDTEVSLRFRLLGATEEAVGELVLANEDGRWYTSDVQIEYRDRQVESQFDPTSTSRRSQ